MKGIISALLIFACLLGIPAKSQQPALVHPDISDFGWFDLFLPALANAIFPSNVWRYGTGIPTASKDEAIWSKKSNHNFILDLEFQNARGTNSGVFVHASNIADWTANCVEIQIANNFDPEWANSPPSWQSAAVFGHQPPTKHVVKKRGEWNHYTISCIDNKIWIFFNGELVNVCGMSLFKSAKTNPDGMAIAEWLSKPLAELVFVGNIGRQGKPAGAPIYFRHLLVKELS